MSLMVWIAAGTRSFHRYSEYNEQILTSIDTCLKLEDKT